MPRQQKNTPQKKKKASTQETAGTQALDRILSAKNRKEEKPAQGGKQKGGQQPKQPKKKQDKPAPKKSSYQNVLDDIDSDDDELNTTLEANRAMRMGGGEENFAERKGTTKAEKKREDKISRQLNEKFDDLLNEEAVITCATGEVAPATLDPTKNASAEQDCLKVEPFTLSFKGNILFQDATVVLAAGHRYGLIGPNGSGKSTFLRNISARKLPGVDPAMDLLHVEQEADGTDELAIDSVLAADVKRTALLEEKTKLEAELQNESISDADAKANNTRLEEVYSELKAIGADAAPARAAKILSGLQFTPEMQVQATKEFSGGWRMRIALARALFRQPSLLLLDEPTNHLDFHAVIWLEEYLRRWKKTLVVVSHDRDFLNSVVDRIVHIDSQKLHLYRGDYDSFMKTYEHKQRERLNLIAKQDKKIKDTNRMLHGDAKAGGKGKKGASKQLTSQQKKQKLKEVEKLKSEKVEKKKDYRVNFAFPEPSHELEPPVIQIDDVTFRYPVREGEQEGKLIFKDLNFAVDMDSRISLVGPNGSGKSTLLGLLFGKLQPTDGIITISKYLRIGYFTQHFVDQLDMEVSPAQHLSRKYPEISYQNVRKALGSFGLDGKLHTRPIQTLSGGQKNRVVFASISLANPDILYLDEPTNHLDVESIEALAEGLESFSGGVVVVSHDARLIDAICNDIWIIGNQTVLTNYEGNIFDYRQSLIDKLSDEDFE